MNASVLFGLVLSLGAPGEKDAAKKDAPSFVGEWDREKAVRGGIEQALHEGGAKVTFNAEGKFNHKDGNKDAEEGTYTVDAKKNPAEIENVPPKQSDTHIGIYKIEGDTL